MQLSQRTLLKRREWTEMVRALPVGENYLPRLLPEEWDALKTCCYRENKRQNELYYAPSNKKGNIKIVVKYRES